MIKYHTVLIIVLFTILPWSIIFAQADPNEGATTQNITCPDPQECRDSAEKAFSSQDFLIALNYFKQISNNDQDTNQAFLDSVNNSRALYNYAITLMSDGKFGQAISPLNRLIISDSVRKSGSDGTDFGLKKRDIHMLLGYACLRTSVFREARANFHTALSIDPKNERIKSLLNITKAYMGPVRVENIHPYNWFEKYAIQGIPKPAYVQNMDVFEDSHPRPALPNCELYVDKNARVAYNLCLNSSLFSEPATLPEKITLPTNMNEVLFDEEDYLEMLVSYVHTADELELTSEQHIEKGNQKMQQGSYAESIEEFSQAIDKDNNCLLAYFRRSAAREQLGEFKKAASDLERYIDLSEGMNKQTKEALTKKVQELRKKEEQN